MGMNWLSALAHIVVMLLSGATLLEIYDEMGSVFSVPVVLYLSLSFCVCFIVSGYVSLSASDSVVLVVVCEVCLCVCASVCPLPMCVRVLVCERDVHAACA